MTCSSLASLSLVLAAACGSSSPSTAPSNTAHDGNAPARCEAAGPELFAMRHSPTEYGRHLLRDGVPMGDSALVVYESGGWVTTGDGPTRAGCLTAADLARAEQVLADAPLVVHNREPGEVHCLAVAMGRTSYFIHGAYAFTSEMCSGDSIDAATMQAFQDVQQLVAGSPGSARTP